jgi:shikimate dehydrogenase
MLTQQIRGSTRLILLLGDPVAHSLSPRIHNHALAGHGLPYVYIPFPVKAEDLHAAILLIRKGGCAGANVTIPHKQQAVHYCDRISDLSQRTGTVNTLYFDGGLLCGTTTDAEGFFRALTSMEYDRRGAHTVILGNGGAARTLAFALAIERSVASLTLAGRSQTRVEGLAREISDTTGFRVGAASLDDPSLEPVLKRCGLLVNCTSAGMWPRTDESPLAPEHFHSGMTVLDVVYNPAETRFLRFAREAGCRAQNGLRMLLYQGLGSFRLWTGVDVSEEMFDLDELSEELAGQGGEVLR